MLLEFGKCSHAPWEVMSLATHTIMVGGGQHRAIVSLTPISELGQGMILPEAFCDFCNFAAELA